jgi:HAMP domain-containing protein/uncharacterized protein (UPF0335 family)
MEVFNHFQLNYFALTAIAALLQWVACTLFLFTLPDKSKPAKYLIAVSVVSCIFATGFVVSHSFYFPTPIPRLVCISVMVLSNVLHSQFVLHFPELKHPRFAKILFRVELLLVFLLIIYLYFSWFKSPNMNYDFEAHYYEIQITDYLKLASLIMVFIVLIFSGICLWYALISTGALRRAYLLMFLGHVGISLIPIPLSLMNRMGIINRELFMSYYCVTGVIGFFIFLTVFINNTSDRTSFLFKIVSVSFLIYILMFNFISNLVLKDRDKSYDLLHLHMQNSILYAEERPDDLRYILKYVPSKGKMSKEYLYKVFDSELQKEDYWQETNISYLLHNLKTNQLTASELESFVQDLKIKDNEFSAGYTGMIHHYLATLPPGEKDAGKSTIRFLRSKETFLFYRYNKVKGMPDKEFRNNLNDFLAKEKEDFLPFKNAILNYLSVSKKEGADLKKDVLLFLVKMKEGEDRKFREVPVTKEALISYHFFGKEKDTIYEVGFSYLAYRQYVHEQAIKLFYALVLGTFLIFIGTPFFLSGALVRPLNELLNGLRKVRKGDLNIAVPIKVQDEIGYLTGSFNTMVQAIRESKEQLQEYSEHLEQKVEERTIELQSTLNTVNVLKTQQDGDYFLTSLLLKPFIVNYGKSENVDIEFLISQKKKFEFHGKKYEIGGDLCHTQNLVLNGKNYILFFNCDSMGKSLQGAGGALVFGSVFFSIVERTNQSILMKDQSPERWIKNAFIELHKVFLTFDGSMLVSSVIGLVEESNGLLYYINAEHPWTVLYRDAKTDFIETENFFSKLGSPMNAKRIFINLFQMKKGDVIFIGSDGRDDFEKPGKSEIAFWGRNINFDEREFLKTVEQAQGHLEKIYEITTEKGVITDDYSLIRIEYKGSDFDGKALRNLIIKNFNNKQFDDSLSYALDYIEKNPSDTEVLFLISHILKLKQNYNSAAYYAERVRIRKPLHIKNLLNLVQIHMDGGSLARAEEILKECKELDSDNAKIPKLTELLRIRKEFISNSPKIN